MLKTTTITQDLKKAMLQKDALKVSVLRMVLAALNNEKIAKIRDLTEAEEIALLQKEVKKRREAIELYQRGQRPELAEKEEQEIKIIDQYLPQMMAEAELLKLIKEMKAKGEWEADFGKTMRLVMVKVKGLADGKLVASLVKQEL